jgi:hypothetical protein
MPAGFWEKLVLFKEVSGFTKPMGSLFNPAAAPGKRAIPHGSPALAG